MSLKPTLVEALDELTHANEFTDIENTAIVYVLRGWFASLSGIPGALQAGDDAWAFTTLFEHYTSLLPNNKAQRSADQLAVQKELATKAQAAQDALDKILGAGNSEDERMSAETDAFVKELVKKFKR